MTKSILWAESPNERDSTRDYQTQIMRDHSIGRMCFPGDAVQAFQEVTMNLHDLMCRPRKAAQLFQKVTMDPHNLITNIYDLVIINPILAPGGGYSFGTYKIPGDWSKSSIGLGVELAHQIRALRPQVPIVLQSYKRDPDIDIGDLELLCRADLDPAAFSARIAKYLVTTSQPY